MRHSAVWRLGTIFMLLTLVVVAHAQELRRVSMELLQGPRGCPHTYRLNVEFLGGASGTSVLASGIVDPPATAGFPGGSRQTVFVDLNTGLNVRMVKNVRIRIEGDRPGQDITSPWDLREVRFSNLEVRRTLWRSETLSQVFDSSHTTWISRDWPTYDVAGTSTPTNRWQLLVQTGGDDLRKDSSASAVLVFRNGFTLPVAITGAEGRGANSNVVLTLPMGVQEQSLSDLVQIHLTKSAYWTFGGSAGRFVYYGERPSNSDDWDVKNIEARVVLGSEVIGRSFPRLTGKITQGLKSSEFGHSFELRSLGRPMSAAMARVAIFIQGDYDVNNLSELPELAVDIRYQGSTVFNRVVGRTNLTQPYVPGQSNLWDGAVWTGENNSSIKSARQNDIYEGSQILYASFPIWRGGAAAPIEEVRIRAYDRGGVSGAISQPFSGNRSVSVRGFWLGFQTAEIPSRGDFVISNHHSTLGMDLSRVTTLNRTTRNLTHRVTHSMPRAR